MKTKIKLAAAIAIIAAGVVGLLARRRGHREARSASPQELVAMVMQFDKNGDGKLTKDEVPERMQGLFARADADHDGILTKEELMKTASATATERR